MRWRCLIAILLGVAILATGSLGNDQVDDLRETVDRPPLAGSAPAEEPSPAKPKRLHWEDPQKKSPHYDCHSDHCDDSESSFGAELLGVAFVATGYALASPFWVPPTLVDDGRQRNGWFTHFPYQFDDGVMTFSLPGPDVPSPDAAEPWEPAFWSMRAESDFGTNFGNQQMIGGHLLWEHRNRFGLETRFEQLQDNFGGQSDSLWFGDVNGTYRFAQSEHWLFRAGLGMNWLADHGDDHYGVNTTYQIDWFPTDPLVFSTDLDYGTLGDAHLFHFQQTAGVTWHGLEARIGYDYLDVGNAQFSMFLCGVRGWF